MKVAIVTDDGETISAHFGRATQYAVVTISDGAVTERALRAKATHHGQHHHGHDHDDHGHGEHGHGGHHGRHRHGEMIAPIQDCDVVIGRGMGRPMHAQLVAAGIRPILTDLRTVDAAVQAFLDGTLTDNPKRVH